MLKKLVVVMLPLLAPALSAAEPEGQVDPVIKLFDGRSLDGWECHLVDPDVKMQQVWEVEGGVLVCQGRPLGYLHTTRDYKNFRLTLQWRWAPGKPPGNSGVLMRATGAPVGFMPKCIEAQLMSGSAGDIWAFRGFRVTGAAARLREVKDHKALGDFVGVAAMKKAEKVPGEWNTYDITFQDDKLTASVNGELVNEATGCDVVAGKIGLQSEGAEIHFRNIQLVPLD